MGLLMTLSHCRHVYEETDEDICSACGRPTHRTDWELQNLMMKKWLKDNPEAWKTVGWWSI
jgi:hypothetical protein